MPAQPKGMTYQQAEAIIQRLDILIAMCAPKNRDHNSHNPVRVDVNDFKRLMEDVPALIERFDIRP